MLVAQDISFKRKYAMGWSKYKLYLKTRSKGDQEQVQ